MVLAVKSYRLFFLISNYTKGLLGESESNFVDCVDIFINIIKRVFSIET